MVQTTDESTEEAYISNERPRQRGMFTLPFLYSSNLLVKTQRSGCQAGDGRERNRRWLRRHVQGTWVNHDLPLIGRCVPACFSLASPCQPLDASLPSTQIDSPVKPSSHPGRAPGYARTRGLKFPRRTWRRRDRRRCSLGEGCRKLHSRQEPRGRNPSTSLTASAPAGEDNRCSEGQVHTGKIYETQAQALTDTPIAL